MIPLKDNIPTTRFPIVTVLLIAVNMAVFIWTLTVSGSLSDYEIERARDYALAEAAKPSLGEFGFRLLAIAALFSTASAINATLFGSANVCYMIARDGELPGGLSRNEWKQATGGLLLTAALVILMTLSFDLSGIAMMGSAAFLNEAVNQLSEAYLERKQAETKRLQKVEHGEKRK